MRNRRLNTFERSHIEVLLKVEYLAKQISQ